MSTAHEISETIADRIREAKLQITTLQAARAALVTDTPRPSPPPTGRPATPDPVGSVTPSSTRERPSPRSRSRRSGNLVAGRLEDLLRASEHGLSLVALAAAAEVSDAKVRHRLHELQREGGVRNSGSRRTSRWHLVSDEDRVAERAAELERMSAPSRR